MDAVVPDASKNNLHTGHCQCGAVQFQTQDLRDIWYCHCQQCRHLTGHYMAACRTENGKLSVQGSIHWTPVSKDAEQGFCENCCSPLFWRNKTQSTISIIAGNLDHTIDLDVRGHIFVAEKGDYYKIDDGLPQFAAHPDGGC